MISINFTFRITVMSECIKKNMKSVLLLPGFLLSVSLPAVVRAYVTCLSCPGVASPSDCRQSMTCGEEEICYTREFKDNRGLQGFRLGCEDGARCTLFFNSKQLFGKRDKCYECCSGDGCNAHLCQGKGTHVPHTPNTTVSPACNCPTTTSTPCVCPSCPQTTCPTTQAGSGCPPFYLPYKHSCYFFATWSVNWDIALATCRKDGGDLVSVNTKDEQEFLVQQLNNSGRGAETSTVWTGGVYFHILHEWQWVDKSLFTYTNWMPGEPGTLSRDQDYHILIANPNYDKSYKEGPWWPGTNAAGPFICERKKTFAI